MAESIYERTSDLPAGDQSVQFTGIVVTYNEARRLRECLNSLAFCEQLIVVDLGSTDESVEIARECGADVMHHQWVPVVEEVWPDTVSLARHDWILRADPDEVFPASLASDVVGTIAENGFVGMISLPHQYYFRGTPLKVTRWGGIHYVPKVFHKDRVRLEPHVHRGIAVKSGYEHQRIEAKNNNVIQHYWIDTYSQLLEKHWRYIKREGKARYQSGERFWWRRWVWETRQALRQNLLDYGGLKGGFTGIFLSFFYAWYICMSLLSLWRYQSKVEKGHALPNAE